MTQKGMTPLEIKAELIRRGIKLKDIATECGVTHSAVWQTIHAGATEYLGLRIRPVIARHLGKKVSEIWPD